MAERCIGNRDWLVRQYIPEETGFRKLTDGAIKGSMQDKPETKGKSDFSTPEKEFFNMIP